MNGQLGGKRQWVVIGGSYPGALSAWFKHLYPDAAVASWSSSGVINAIEDFRMFDADIWQTTSNSSDACAQKIVEVTNQIDQIFKNGTQQELESMLKTFKSQNLKVAHGDFMFFVADIFTMGVQYGTRTAMCQLLTSSKFAADPLGQLAAFANTKGVAVEDYDAVSLAKTKIDTKRIVRQWTYQYCTEFGWF